MMFVISTLVLVIVSLATGKETEAKLRGLTFATLDEPYSAFAGGRRTVAIQVVASVLVSIVVIALWVHFA
jgi:hypothetical protein